MVRKNGYIYLYDDSKQKKDELFKFYRNVCDDYKVHWYYNKLKYIKNLDFEKSRMIILDSSMDSSSRYLDISMLNDVELNNILRPYLYNKKDLFIKKEKYIIYDEFTLEDGNKYGREIITGCLFPIMNYDNMVIKFKYTIGKYNYDKSECICYGKPFIEFKNSSLDKIVTFIIEDDFANTNEINSYMSLYKKIFFNNKERQFRDRIMKLSQENVFNREIKEKEQSKDKIVLNPECSIFTDIEYNLFKLNENDRKAFKEEYDKILNEQSNNDITLMKLMKLKAEIELRVIFSKKNANNIMECLNAYKKEYLEKLGSNDITNINLAEIDNFFLLLSKVMEDYSLVEQRNIIDSFGFIYLMEIYENKDSITLEDLKDTYVKNIIRNIIINIKALEDVGLFKRYLGIENNDNISLEDLLDIIKSLELSKESFKKKIMMKGNLKDNE